MSDEVIVRYSAFGLLLSSNLPIPGLVPSGKFSLPPDVEIHLGVRPPAQAENATGSGELYYESTDVDERGEPAFRIRRTADGKFLRLDYLDGIQFWLDRSDKAVWASWPAGLTIEDAATYLLGPILGLLLRLRGVTCLHASAAAFGECAVAFAGSEGAGKSTTAAALGRRGHAILSDDIVAIEERDGAFFVLPAHPYLCLWPESVETLYGPDKTLPGFAPNWDKGRLSLAENDLRFEARALQLGAVCLLGERSTDAAAPFVETPPSRESLLLLIANSYAANLLDKEMRAREFELLGRLVASVPVWRVRPHEDAARIDRLCQVIQERCGNMRVAR